MSRVFAAAGWFSSRHLRGTGTSGKRLRPSAPDSRQQVVEHHVGVEMLLGDTPGSAGVRQIILVDGCNPGNSFLRCAKCKESCPSGEPPLHARRLNQSRLAGGEVT